MGAKQTAISDRTTVDRCVGEPRGQRGEQPACRLYTQARRLRVPPSPSASFFPSRRRHTRYIGDWSSDVCSSDLAAAARRALEGAGVRVAGERDVLVLDVPDRPGAVGEIARRIANAAATVYL